ncbi:MAG: hypothetical protein ACM3MG_10305 [Bacillota bacterium]
MSLEMGVFALRQLVSSMVVVGPILIIVGLFNFVFTQNRKVVMAYVVTGACLTLLGAWNLYVEFGGGRTPQGVANSESASLGPSEDLKDFQ